jgi:hypothetical protein
LVAGPAAVEQLAQAAAEESKSLLDYLAITRAVLFNQFLNAAEAGDRAHVANVAGRLLESLREIGRITGELREVSGLTINHNTINLFGSPEFLALQEGLLTIARQHPAVKADIVALLRNLDAKPLGGGLPAPGRIDLSGGPETGALDALERSGAALVIEGGS